MDGDEREYPFRTEIVEHLRETNVWQRIHETASKLSGNLVAP